MATLTFVKKKLRKLLSVPFSLSTVIRPNSNETYQELGTHQVGLRQDERVEYEPIFREFMTQKWRLRKFIYTIRGNILLDTSLGWALSGLHVLHYSNTSLVEQMGTPALPNAIKWLANRYRATYYPEVIWMPYGTSNYWHFLNDFLGALYLLKDIIKERHPVILIHENIANMRSFQELRGYSDFLNGLTYVVHRKEEWVRCTSFITARTYFGTSESLRDTISLLNKKPPVTTKPLDKIFISRASSAFRRPSNLEELNIFFARHGFRVVLLDDLRVHEQIDLINSARIIAALHGAGMVNLAFHAQPTEVTVIEITPEDYINPCYAFLAEELGMDYHVIGAGPRDITNNFNFPVSLDKVKQMLERLSLA